eukprot:2791560-Rhodomonas_salina.2
MAAWRPDRAVGLGIELALELGVSRQWLGVSRLALFVDLQLLTRSVSLTRRPDTTQTGSSSNRSYDY